MQRLARASFFAVGLSACTLLTQLDGLSGGAPDGAPGSDSSVLDGPSLDARGGADASTDSGGDGDRDGGTSADADAAAACGSPGPTPGLLAYYPFDEGAGSVVHDCSGSHIDGTLIQQASNTWTTGIKGGALRVATPNGCVDLGVPAALQAPTMSIAAWLNVRTYPSGPATGYVMGQTLNADSSGWRLAALIVDGGGAAIGWQQAIGGTKYVVTAPGPAASAWHHVALTFAPNVSVKIFVDGTLAGSQNGLPPIMFSAVSLRIGCRADGANFYDGLIDELRVYNRVLTATEIASLAMP